MSPSLAIFMALSAASLACACGAAVARATSDAPTLQWESLACVLDETAGVPYAWGVASALRNAPALLGRVRAARVLSVVAAGACAAWAVRVAADALFVPVDECAPLAEWAAGGERSSLDDIVTCARGTSLMVLIHSDRYALGLVLDEAAAAAAGVAQDGLLGTMPRLPLRLVKAAIAMSAPGDGTLGFFVGMHLESAWDWILGLNDV